MSTRVDDPSTSPRAKCTGHSSRTGNPCGRYPNHGMTVCNSHGGRAPQVRAKAAANVLQSDLQRALQRRMKLATPVTDPLSALQAHAGEVHQWYGFLRDQIEELRSSSQWNTEQINGVAELFTRAMSEMRQTLKDIASLKIDERLVAIEQAKVAMMQRAMMAGLAAVGVTGPAAQQAIRVMVNEIRLARPVAVGGDGASAGTGF